MNDIRRTILWVIFGLSLVMLWDQWQVYNGRKPTFFPGPNPTATQASAANPVRQLRCLLPLRVRRWGLCPVRAQQHSRRLAP